MAIFVSKQEVLNNLNRFKMSRNNLPVDQPIGSNVISAMINPQTGDIQFAKAESGKGWTPIEVVVIKSDSGRGVFQAKTADHHAIDINNMTPIAWSVMKETLRVLNEITAVSDLSEIQIAPVHSIQSLRGWVGAVSRMEAEMLLANQRIGTYLLRHGDEFTIVIADKLAEGNNQLIEAFVCTVTEDEDKISDILIVRLIQGWALYRDNPDLFDSEYVYHKTPEALLLTLGDKIQCAL
jgi:hypothetical protein